MNADSPIRCKVREFVLDYARGRGTTEVSDEESLLKANIIDSLGVFRMIAFLEENFPITIEDTDMVPENFQSIVSVESFVNGKMAVTSESVPCGQPPAAVA
jgi:acyl carrier protein